MTTTPTTWLDSIQVNTDSTGFQGMQDVVGLSNGNILVVYADDSGTVGTGIGRDIIGVIYDAEGNIVTTAFQVNTFGNADSEEMPAIAATNDGGFVMAYEDRDGTAPTQQILIQRYNASGTSIDQGFVQVEPSTEFISSPKIAVNQTDNSIFVSYQWSDGNDDSIRGKRLDANLNVAAGTPADGYVVRSDDFPSDGPGAFNNSTAVLSNGNFVTVFSEPDNSTSGADNIEFLISNGTTGANIVSANVTSGAGDEEITPDVSALTGGGFVVVWREVETLTNGDDTGDNIQFARYSDSGSLQGSITTVVDTGNEYWDPAVIGLEDGGFFIAAYDATSDSIEGTRFDASGVQVGGNMVAFANGITNFPDIELSLTSDGRILLTYDDASGDVQVEILDPRDAGTITAEAGDGQTTARISEDTTLIGSSVADTLLGQDGDDEIFGGSGIDVLYGGDGDDLLNGGLFTDQSFGGAGNDTFQISAGNAADDVFGGAGTDTLDFSASGLGGDVTFDTFNGGTYLGLTYDFTSIEVILGNNVDRDWDLFFGVQSVVAGSGNDTFIHGEGEFVDNLDAGDGIDTFDASLEVVAGAGTGVEIDNAAGTIVGMNGPTPLTFLNFENIIGTQHADTITGDSDDETLDGQGGDDILNGAAGNDVMYGGDGNDTFNHDDGDDSWFGGAGNDAFNGLNFSESDTVDGGAGTDTFSVQGSGSQWTLANNIAMAGSQSTTLTGIEIFVGSNQNDDIDEGNGAINEFYGDDGDDIIRTNGINNTNETFDGGTGVDTLDFSDETGNTTFDMTTGSLTGAGAATNFENAIGGSGNDTITGTAGDNTIDGGAGDDILSGLGGSNTYIVADDGSTNSVNGSTVLDTIDVSGFTSGIFVGQNSVVNPTGDYNIVSGNGTVIENANRESKTLIATDSDDVINEFNLDVIYAGAGNDEVIVYQSPSANEAYFGGAGTGDTLNLADGINGAFDNLYGEVNLATGVLTGTGGAFGFENAIGTEGDNTITGTAGDNSIDGAAGNDTLIGGSDADILYGGDDNDVLYGGNDDDVLYGGDNVDSTFGGSGNDTIFETDGLLFEYHDGGDGIDTIDYTGAPIATAKYDLDAGLISFNTGSSNTETALNFENVFTAASDSEVIGTTGANLLVSQGGDDSIAGLGGGDSVLSGAGNDTLDGGSGNDTLDGGTGNDTLIGGAGTDSIDGGTGIDIVDYSGSGAGISLLLNGTASSGGDAEGDMVTNIEIAIGSAFVDTLTSNSTAHTLDGGSGNDTIIGAGGADSILGGTGNDSVNAGTGDDTVDGGAGADEVFGSSGADSILGGLDNDLLFGGSSGDDLDGGDGEDQVFGSVGADSVAGGAGNDTVNGGTGDDEVYGGTGNDSLLGSSDDDELYGGDGNDTIDGGSGDDQAFGGIGDDSITGSSGRDTLFGGDDDDNIDGGGSGDSLFGQAGMDTLAGGAGDDELYGGDDGDTVMGEDGEDEVFGGGGIDFVYGGIGNDTAYGGGDADIVEGGDGDDLLFGSVGNDSIGGGVGNDEAYGGVDDDTVDGGLGNDEVFGAGGDDTVLGGGGDDTVNGGTGNDTINGGADDDLLIGSSGDDVVIGGAGNDTLNGGSGADTFVFEDALWGMDTLTGWQDGQDLLDFTAAGLGFGDFNVAASGGGTLLTLTADPNQTLFLDGIAPGTIDGFDFV